MVAEGKKECILKLLHKIFEERFRMPAEIRMTFKEKEKSNEAEMEDVALQREINAIFARSTVYQEEKQAENQ